MYEFVDDIMKVLWLIYRDSIDDFLEESIKIPKTFREFQKVLLMILIEK